MDREFIFPNTLREETQNEPSFDRLSSLNLNPESFQEPQILEDLFGESIFIDGLYSSTKAGEKVFNISNNTKINQVLKTLIDKGYVLEFRGEQLYIIANDQEVKLDIPLQEYAIYIASKLNSLDLKYNEYELGVIFQNAIQEASGPNVSNIVNPLVLFLHKLKVCNIEAYSMLVRSQEAGLLFESKVLLNLLCNLGKDCIRFENQGQTQTLYKGGFISNGSYKNIHWVMYDDSNGEVKINVLKTPIKSKSKATTKINQAAIQGEGESLRITSQWNCPYIQPIILSSQTTADSNPLLVVESGLKPIDMHNGIYSFEPLEWLEYYSQTIVGLEEFWKHGCFHGDIKPSNIITYQEQAQEGVEEAARKAVLTDVSMNNFSHIFIPYARTKTFSFHPDHMIKQFSKLLGQGKSESEAKKILGIAQDVRALLESLKQFLVYSPHVTDSNKALLSRLKQASKIKATCQPEALATVKEVTAELRAHFSQQ